MKRYISSVLFIAVLPAIVFSASADSNDFVLQSFNNLELQSSGGLCFISDAAHRVIVASKGADQVKISGTILPLTRTDTSQQTITWTADNLTMVFTATKRKALESDPGASASGMLQVTYKGQTSSIKAIDKCDGEP